MKRNIESLTFGVFAVGLAILALVGFVSYRSNELFVRDSTSVSQSYEVLAVVDGLQQSIDAANAATLEYLSTHDRKDLQQLNGRIKALEHGLTDVRQLTSDNAEQQALIRELAGLLSERTAFLTELASSRAPVSDLTTAESEAATQQIVNMLRMMEQEEQKLLSQRQERTRKRIFYTRLVIFVGTGLSLVLVASATMFIRRDTMARKRARQRVSIQYATTRLLSESSTLQQAAKRLLPELALTLDFDTAELWMMDYGAVKLRCANYWLASSIPASYADTIATTELNLNEGIPGRVYAHQEPLWITDVQSAPEFCRHEVATEAGLHSAIAVPVLIWPDVAGVLLLISRRQTELDRELFQTLAAVGAQLGQFITRRRAIERLQETTELQRAILESANFSIISTDATGTIKSVNSTGESWLLYRAEQLIGRQTPVVLHDSAELIQRAEQLSAELGTRFESGFDSIVGKAARGEIQEGDWTYVRADGTKIPVHLSVTALRNHSGEISGFLFIAQDITERREIDRMKNEFISVVSHELRTPLTSIRGSLGLLASGMLGNVSEKAQRMLQIGISNTDRLVRLINDILDIERLESGKIALERQSISAEHLVVQATDAMRGMAEKNSVRLEIVATDAMINADPDRIVQTLTNLISNAIKYSNAHEKVVVECGVEGECVQFSVRDTGRGIPEEKRQAIFERFQQVDASDSREKGGTGLGLAICRTIVQQHGGRIWVDSKLGEGSTFYFTVPLAEPALTASAEARGNGPRILICDDDPWLLSVVSNVLHHSGFTSVIANSGEEMLQKARSERPDVILLDLIMPGMSGWDALRELRSDEHLKTVPVLVLSGLSERENADAATVRHVSGWVQKPFDAQQLRQAIEAVAHRTHPLVLLVEDDSDLSRVIASTLERDGVEVVLASGTADALQLVAERSPDLLVLDLVLADGDGYEVVRSLRQHDVLRTIPVVVYSAEEVSADDRERLRLGATEFLTKARVSPEQLERLVLQLLRVDVLEQTKGEQRGEKAHSARG